ncbi:MAG: hypothetical protein ACYSU0_00960 [Planctomycetota bacterium]
MNAMPRGLCWALLALTLGSAAKGETVSGTHYQFSIPDGFEPFPQGKQTPGVAHSYLKGDLTDSELDVIVMVEVLPGTLGRDYLKEDMLPADGGVSFVYFEWRSFKLQGTRVRETLDVATTVTYNVMVPLLPRAVQLKVVGEEARDAELLALTEAIVRSFDGKTNWLNTEERAQRVLIGGGRLLLTIAIALFILGLIARRLWRRRPTGASTR